jgi:predicted signal transduction protein with EAL and GGDEF domain
LRAHALPQDIVARLGGDEFAVLRCAPVLGAEELSGLAEDLIQAISVPIEVGEYQVTVGLSVGIALATSDSLEADKLFKCADLALYRAKKDGRETFRFFETSMDEAVEERRKLGLALAGALANGGFSLHYQPLVDAATGRIHGFEALLRWEHPTRGMVPPSVFIPIAEESGLIAPIGDWVVRAACAEAMRWRPDLRVAVNISPVQLQRGCLAQTVVAALAASGLPASRLELEVTESALLGGEDFISQTLIDLRRLGVKIALDDFGTGYSSLSYLCRFAVDRIKIDRSFIERLCDPNSVAVVNAIIGLGRQLGMDITAEGIETQEQLDILRAAGCGEVQGYLFSAPRPAHELPLLLAASEDRKVA